MGLVSSSIVRLPTRVVSDNSHSFPHVPLLLSPLKTAPSRPPFPRPHLSLLQRCFSLCFISFHLLPPLLRAVTFPCSRSSTRSRIGFPPPHHPRHHALSLSLITLSAVCFTPNPTLPPSAPLGAISLISSTCCFLVLIALLAIFGVFLSPPLSQIVCLLVSFFF